MGQTPKPILYNLLHARSPKAEAYGLGRTHDLKQQLEQLTGHPIEADALREAIAEGNSARQAIRALLQQREGGAPRGSSFSVTAPCAARCSNTCRTPGSGDCSSQLVLLPGSLLAGAADDAGARIAVTGKRASGTLGTTSATALGSSISISARASTAPGSRKKSSKRSPTVGDDRPARDPRPAASLAEFDLHTLGVRDP